MRELMFRAETKARRINKIKSKTYRKIKRKEKEKLKEKTLEADGLEGGSDAEESRLKSEVERARERATLRHKSTGKWAKAMKQKHFDGSGREEIEEILHRGEQLRRKIQGIGSDESEEEESSEEDKDADTQESIMKIKKAAFEEIKEFQDSTSTNEHEGKKGKGIFEMKFMKDAMAREQAKTDRMVDDFIKEVGGDVGEGSDDEQQNQLDELDTASGVLVNRTGGRLAFRPGAPQNQARLGLRTLGSLASDVSSVTLKSTDFISPPDSPRTTPKPLGPSNITLSGPTVNEVESNPWLTRDTDSSSKAPRKKNEMFGKESQRADKSKNKLKKRARKAQEEKEKAKEDAKVEISMDQNLTLQASLKHPKASASSKSAPAANPSTSAVGVVAGGDSDSDADSEVDAQEAAILKTKVNANPKGLKAIQQRDLVALAFAGDNVVHVRGDFQVMDLSCALIHYRNLKNLKNVKLRLTHRKTSTRQSQAG